MRHWLFLLALSAGCVEDPFARPPVDCETREAWWADTDSDGVGDPGGEVYVGCDDPGAGWTDTPPPDASDTDDTDDTDGGR